MTGAARTGQVLLTVALVATIAGEVAFTWLGWTGQHIFNPRWHPHARYHAVQMSVCIGALSLGALVLLWRRGVPARTAAIAAEVLLACWWGAEFVAAAVPGTSPDPDLAHPNTFPLLGVPVHGNLFFAVVMVVLSALGGRLLRRSAPGDRPGPPERSAALAAAPGPRPR